MSDKVKHCFNIGCNKEFTEEDNAKEDNPCCFHSDLPEFHDGGKRWKCCQQKSSDFTTFLSLKGCQRGKHSNVKQVFQSVEKVEPKIDKTVEEKNEIKVEEEIDFQFNESFRQKLLISESKALEKMPKTGEKGEQLEEKICENCGKSDKTKTECVFHSGSTIFHDSLKYWSCCPRKKFTDFEEFQQLIGCQNKGCDGHVFKDKTLLLRKREIQNIRMDWFQTNQNVSIVFYGLKVRKSIPSSVETNGRTLWIEFNDENDCLLFEKTLELNDFVFGDKSRVTLDKTKVEVILEKVYKNKLWPKLLSD